MITYKIMQTIKQHNLPRGARVKIENGKYLTFIKMDGMFGQWTDGKNTSIFNFDSTFQFKKNRNHYKIIKINMETKKDYTNPNRWNTNKIVNKVEGIKEKLKTVPKKSKEWYVLQMKREVAGVKKHIINFESFLDDYEKQQ